MFITKAVFSRRAIGEKNLYIMEGFSYWGKKLNSRQIRGDNRM